MYDQIYASVRGAADWLRLNCIESGFRGWPHFRKKNREENMVDSTGAQLREHAPRPWVIPSSVVEIHPSWSSVSGSAAIFFGLAGVGALVLGLVLKGDEAGVLLLWFAPMSFLLMSGGLWSVLDRMPVLRITPSGVNGRAFSGREVPWNSIERIDVLKGGADFRFVMMPSAAGGRQRACVVSSVALSGADQQRLREALHVIVSRADTAESSRMREQVRESRATAAFEHKLATLTPHVWAMPVVMGLCVVVWVAMVTGGTSVFGPKPEDVHRWGGSTAWDVQAGEWWRLGSAMFVHAGVEHLALNMAALWPAGWLLTRLLGNRGFLLVYFGAGLVGAALSLHFSGQRAICAGASGAVFGVIGALMASVTQHHGKFPGVRGLEMVIGLLFYVVLSLVAGSYNPAIDNAAHIGGLLAGLVAGWVLVEKVDVGPSRSARAGRFLLAAALMGGGTAAVVIKAPVAGTDVRAMLGQWRALEAPSRAHEEAMLRLNDDYAAVKRLEITSAELAVRIEKVHIPGFSRVTVQLDALRLSPEGKPGKLADARRRHSAFISRLLLLRLRELTVAPATYEERREEADLVGLLDRVEREIEILKRENRQ
ncbi:MAG: rhomboid family intramembrane serine protease [Polaromonas sp.]|uniref:rhomboid family intramembrane serine protease n=1 Tax=Polaromonas sp. TaxID=1869339 RepID=UPI004035CB14